MDFKRLADRAKNIVDKRGGTDALKEDLNELKDIAKGQGTISDKAKKAAESLKDPGKRGGETPGGTAPGTTPPATGAPSADPPAGGSGAADGPLGDTPAATGGGEPPVSEPPRP